MRRGAPIVAVTITSSSGASETFRTTEEHPFYVADQGWTTVGQLEPGDPITTLSGQDAFVLAISYTGEQADVFNLEVEGLHDYYVGASGVLVHNTSDLCVIRGNPWSVLDYISKNGKAPPGYKGGQKFKNLERQLPVGVQYREWDIYPKPSKDDYALGANRGLERLVSGSDGSWWCTDSHYTTFTQLK